MPEQIARLVGVGTGHAFHDSSLDGQRDELLLCTVVDVAFDTAALAVLGGNEALPRGPQLFEVGPKLLGEPDVAKHQPRLSGQVVHGKMLLRSLR